MDALIRLRPDFVECLNEVETVIDHLFAGGVFSNDNMCSVLSHPNRREQVRELLNILSRKLPSALAKFHQILLITDNQMLAEKMDHLKSQDIQPPVRYPTQESTLRGYIVGMEGYNQNNDFVNFIDTYIRNTNIQYKSVLGQDFNKFFHIEMERMLNKQEKYEFVLYFVMCDCDMNPIHNMDSNIACITEVIVNDQTHVDKVMCLFCYEDESKKEIKKCNDRFIFATLNKVHFRKLLRIIPSNLSLLFTNVHKFVNQL